MSHSDAVGPPLGPSGKNRSIATSILLAIVTVGIYTFVWTYKTHEELKRHTGAGVGGVIGLVIYFVLSPVTYFVIPSEIGQLQRRAGVEQTVRGLTGLWLLLPLVGTLVWFIKVQRALNNYWASSAGATS